MSRFTKGPWLQAEGNETFIYALNDLGTNRFWFFLQSSGQGKADDDELIANANLISAAPDMYESLKAMHDHFKYLYGEDDPYVLDSAKALAKADGKGE